MQHEERSPTDDPLSDIPRITDGLQLITILESGNTMRRRRGANSDDQLVVSDAHMLSYGRRTGVV